MRIRSGRAPSRPTGASLSRSKLHPKRLWQRAKSVSTLEYYKNGIKNLAGFALLATSTLDTITNGMIAAFVTKRREAGLEVTSINRQLEVLRRMQKLGDGMGKVSTALPKVEMLPGENHRDRVLTTDEEERYLEGTAAVAEGIRQAYPSAPEGIRATMRGQQPTEPADPFLLRDVATVLLDCGLRPDECFRRRHTCLTRWAEYMDPFTLAYLAGHSDFSTTRRYVHPQAEPVRTAIKRARSARGRHNSGHSDETAAVSPKAPAAGTQ